MGFRMDDLRNSQKKVVGTKQTLKSLENGEAIAVFLADDAEERVVKPIEDLCRNNNIACEYLGDMVDLGRVCGIKVGAAAVAIIEM